MKKMTIEIDLEKSIFESFTTWEIERVLKEFCKELKKEDVMERWNGQSFLRDGHTIVGTVLVEGYPRVSDL